MLHKSTLYLLTWCSCFLQFILPLIFLIPFYARKHLDDYLYLRNENINHQIYHYLKLRGFFCVFVLVIFSIYIFIYFIFVFKRPVNAQITGVKSTVKKVLRLIKTKKVFVVPVFCITYLPLDFFVSGMGFTSWALYD